MLECSVNQGVTAGKRLDRFILSRLFIALFLSRSHPAVGFTDNSVNCVFLVRTGQFSK